MIDSDRIPEGPKDYCAASARRARWLVEAFPPRMRTLPALLTHQARIYGDRVLVRATGGALTYGEAPDKAARLAGALAAHGVQRGDRVAILCGNRIEFMELIWAVGWLGAILVPINTASRGFQLQHILTNSGAKILIVEESVCQALDTIEREKLSLEKVFVLGGSSSALPPGTEPMPALTDPVPAAELKFSDILAILYTSGTTGVSKGVCCSHAQYFWWAIYTGRQLGVREGDVLQTTLPLFHTNAFNTFFQALLNGGTQVVEYRFSVSRFWSRLNESEATVTYLLGAMVPMLLSQAESPEERDHGVRVALAPGVPARYHEDFVRRTGIIPLDGFGSTESNAVIGLTLENYRPGYMGTVNEGFQARVVDEDDLDVPDGAPGELLLRADQPYAFANGYHEMAEKTVETWKNLWLHTGDRVVREPDGNFRFVDRIKEAIRRRGENISSYEVEQAVLSHPSVSMVAAFPVKSELAEDEVMVAIVLKEDATLDPAEMIRHCETRMPYFAVPRFIDVVTALPQTENGKVQKFKLSEAGVTDTTWDREAAGVTVKR